MNKGKLVVDIAFKEVGTKEYPRNSNMTKYGAWFGLNGLPWCGMFVSWVYFQAGLQLPKIGFLKGFAGCQVAVKYFKTLSLITIAPTVGCLVFYDWNGDGRFDHVEIFNGWKDKGNGEFYAIGGNTSKTSLSNGGEVQSVTRNIGKGVIFVIPLQLT